MSDSDDRRSSERFAAAKQTAIIYGLAKESVIGLVVNESFGGIAIKVPGLTTIQQPGAELLIDKQGVKTYAVLRHIENEELGLEWKAQAIANAFRRDSTSESHRPLADIMPGGLSLMWKLYESRRFEQLGESADRLRRESAACGVLALSEPISEFQNEVRDAINQGDDCGLAIRDALDQLISACEEAVC